MLAAAASRSETATGESQDNTCIFEKLFRSLASLAAPPPSATIQATAARVAITQPPWIESG
jgi:hypothetical protein